MGQKKLIRFAAIKNFSNVLEYPDNIAGQWSEKFQNPNPIILELACGRGEYAVGLAELNNKQNLIGVDIKGNRMFIGAKKALTNGLNNVMFLRTQIEKIAEYFNPEEVNEIWITFPDPQLRTSRAKKRLTHPRFLRLYQKILKNNGVIHLKTDSPNLYQFTLRVITLYRLILHESCDDVYGQPDINPALKIKTFYEGLDIAGSNKIFYLKFSLPDEIKNIDDELQQILKETEHSD